MGGGAEDRSEPLCLPASLQSRSCHALPQGYHSARQRKPASPVAKARPNLDRWTPSLTTYAFPTIGAVPVSDLSTDHVLSVLQPMWATIPDAGRRLRNVIAAVLDYARTRGWRTGDNPAAWDGHLEHVLPQATRIKPAGQHEAMRWQDAPAFCSRLSSLATTPAHTLLFAILTAGRKDEILGATWPEFDLEGRVWTIPAGRMKAGREHRVPLSDAAMAVVRGMQAQSLPRHGGLCIPWQGWQTEFRNVLPGTSPARRDRGNRAWLPQFLPRLVCGQWARARTCGIGAGARCRRGGGGRLKEHISARIYWSDGAD